MKNFVQPGRVLTAVAPTGGVESGELVLLGAIFGVAATSALEGEQFELCVGGVYELPKTSAQAWTFGQVLYMTTAGIVTSVSTDNTKIGVAAAVADNPSGSGLVRLNDNF